MQSINLTTSANLTPSIPPLSQSTSSTKEFYKIYVYFRGTKKRCRKSESHSMFIGYHPYNNGTYDRSEIIDKATNFLLTNVKSIDSRYTVSISLDYVLETTSDDFTSQLWHPFGDKNVKIYLNSIAGFND